MISKTLTGITFSGVNSTYEIPCAINDTFVVGTPINFICDISLLNNLIGTSINSGNISSFSLFARIITETTPDTYFSNVFSLSSSNIQNNCIVVDLDALLSKVTNDTLTLYSLPTDVQNLHKKFRIAFRIFSNSSGVGNQLVLLNTDIVSKLNLCFNTLESGPYDVKYEQIDLFSPNDFSIAERNSIFQSYPAQIGVESVRAFYPENLNINSPLIVYNHGNNQYVEGVDSYLSTFASYGYFCISVSVENDTNIHYINYHKILLLVDHFKNKIQKISNGQYANKIDFTKLIFSGLSRGGYTVELIPQVLRVKNSQYSAIKNITIDYSHLKAIIPIGDVTINTCGDDGIMSLGNVGEGSLDPDENNIHYYTVNHNIPIIKILGFNDNQSFTGGITNTMFNPGFSYNNKLNYLDKYALFSNFDHNRIIDLTSVDANGERSFSSSHLRRNTKNHLFNSNRIILNEYISNILYFLSINCFQNNTLKKLRFIEPKKQKFNKILANEIKNIIFHTFFPAADDISYQLNNFYGSTLSYAGSTGFTLSNPLGFTFDYCYDSSYYTSTNPLVGQTYIDNLKEMKTMWIKTEPNGTFDLTDNDTFNGVQLNSYKSLFVPIESNISIGHTFQSVINLSENNYIGLRACQTYIYAFPGTTTNSNFSNFNLSLIDINGNTSTLSSRIYSNGFYPQIDVSTNLLLSDTTSAYPTVPNFCFFRAGDFVFKNNSIGITQINQMRLDFGPDYGSTFSHIALDAFVVYKEL
jgi:hypothetical protein